MKKLFCLLIVFSIVLFAQAKNKVVFDSTITGIRFEGGLQWQQIIDKARTENKFILVDCYTTWCLPCRKMEQSVYTLKKVGDFFNEKFISVKFQMDSTVRDSEIIKSQYKDASRIKDDFSVDGFPTYLIFTSEGKLLYRFMGMKDADAFIKAAAEAINPEGNYYNFLQDYKNGKVDYPKIALMARTAMTLKDTINATILATDYISHLKKNDCFTAINIDFLREFTKSTKDFGFKIIYQNSDTVNKVVGDKDFSQKFVQNILYREFVAGALQKAKERGVNPDWTSLNFSIKKQFGNYYAQRVIASCKPVWYRKQNNLVEYTKSLVLYFDEYEFPKIGLFKKSTGSFEDLIINNYAWEVFKYSNNDLELKKALVWSNRAITMNPIANWMDTYANLLYKLGKNELAIQWELLALKIEPNNEEIKGNLAKMQTGKATWPIEPR